MNCGRNITVRAVRGLGWLAGLAIAYVLSCGPVLAISFRLREATGWDEFYAVMWLYYPLLGFGREGPIRHAIYAYIGWWVSLLGAVGPG